MGGAAGVPRERPDDEKPDAAADDDKSNRERPVENLVALGELKGEVGCASFRQVCAKRRNDRPNLKGKMPPAVGKHLILTKYQIICA
jgi:hypothetical protein